MLVRRVFARMRKMDSLIQLKEHNVFTTIRKHAKAVGNNKCCSALHDLSTMARPIVELHGF